jgi:hypothetical protein
MRDGDHVEHGAPDAYRRQRPEAHVHPLAPRRVLALLVGLVAFVTVGALMLLYVGGIGADVLVAVIGAMTPGAAP